MKKTGKNDSLLIVVLLTGALIAGAGMWFARGTGTLDGVAVVTVDGEVYGRYPLKETWEERIELADGSYNYLVIKDGKADILEASCPDRICVNHRPIEKGNQSIVCLPNKLIVTVENGEVSQVDSQTY